MTHSDSTLQFVSYAKAFDASFEDMPRRVPDITKIRQCVGYRPTVHLNEIIERVIDFWRPEQLVTAPRVVPQLVSPLGVLKPAVSTP
jgi:hypothetical protein